jgi:serine-protein kinase ATM
LEQPDQIMSGYLAPAIVELKGQIKGTVAGQVFHQFASFCDNQLRNSDLNSDFNRVQRMRDTRKKEMEHWEQIAKSMKSSPARDKVKSEYRKAQKWFKLDNKEYERLRGARESFMTQSLENYLLSLCASDSHDNDVLRFFSIWLEFTDSALANASVGRHLEKVPSAKFSRLMNQLSSRLQNEETAFQELLSQLVLRIATEHPYHAMHHIAAGTSSIGVKDGSAKSRMIAAKAIAGSLKASNKTTSAIWHNIAATDQLYHNLATLHDNKGDNSIFKANRELNLDDFSVGRSLTTKIKDFRVPPPTMAIQVREDMNYSRVPKVIGFRPKMRIANGLSAPKIVTATCSDGHSFKQLVGWSSPMLLEYC